MSQRISPHFKPIRKVHHHARTLYIITDIVFLDQSESGGEDQKLLNWLSPLTFWAMHSDTFGRRQPGTGEWLLVDERFQSWISGETKYLWCPGDRNSLTE